MVKSLDRGPSWHLGRARILLRRVMPSNSTRVPVAANRPVGESWRGRFRVGSALLCLSFMSRGFGAEIMIRDDLDVGVWSPFGTRWEAESTVCISGVGVYGVTASSLDRGDRFVLGDDAGNEVAYNVFWRQQNIPGTGIPLLPGIASGTATIGDIRPDCGGEANAGVRIRVDDVGIDQAPAGLYSDSLVLTLVPL